MSGTERESERERSGERAESAAHAAKVRVKPVVLCTICTVHFSEAKRGPGPGTSRLDSAGNPMTFFSLPPYFHPYDQLWSLCNVCRPIHYTVSPISSIAGYSLHYVPEKMSPGYFCYSFVYTSNQFS